MLLLLAELPVLMSLLLALLLLLLLSLLLPSFTCALATSCRS
jgi:hypothetical protein